MTATDRSGTAPARLRGVVVDVLGAPIVGASVVLRRGDDEVLARTATSHDGGFAFAVEPVLGDERVVSVDVAAAGKAHQTNWWRAGETWLQFELREACSLHGRVVDANGAALPGVEVTARHVGEWDKASVRTAVDGSFEFAALPIGRHTVMVYRAGHQLAILEVATPSATPVVICLVNAHERTMRVRVVGATREQLAAATCHLHSPTTDLPESCCRGALDEHGVWEVRGLPNQVTASLHVASPGLHIEPGHAFCHAHPQSGCYEFAFTCKPRLVRELRGRLVQASGAPLAGARLEVDANHGGDATSVSDVDGRFLVTTAAPDGDVVRFVLPRGEFVLDGPGLEEFRSPARRHEYLIRMPWERELELVAVLAASLRVRCRHHDGAPAAHAFAVVWCAWQTQPGQRTTSQLATGSTDDDGEIVFPGLHPGVGGPVFVTVAGPGWQAKSEPMRLEAGAVLDVPLLAPAIGSLEGTLRDPAGQPLVGHAVGAYTPDCEHPQFPSAVATSDRAGRFRFASLAVGSWHLGPANEGREAPWRSGPIAIRSGVPLQRDVVVGEVVPS